MYKDLMSQSLAEKIKSHSLYPSIKQTDFADYKNALCEFKVQLPFELKARIESFTEKTYQSLVSSLDYNPAVLNCFDFHYSNDLLKLIEINTNGSGFLLSNLLLNDEDALKYEEVLLDSFLKSFGEKPHHIFINDENPFAEKMFVEFLMYHDFFKRNEIEAQIVTTRALTKIISSGSEAFSYNRDCDFHLEENPEIRKAWESKKLILSAHPEIYERIATKKRLIDLSSTSEVFLDVVKVTEENADDLWSKRKSLFFKPEESYGSKGVYAGKSVSKKRFEDLVQSGEYLAQELHPPGKIIHDSGEWKFDLRVFFSRERVEKILARVYRGQVTNFKEPGGGFALIDWIE